jgi:hypothetical protein
MPEMPEIEGVDQEQGIEMPEQGIEMPEIEGLD